MEFWKHDSFVGEWDDSLPLRYGTFYSYHKFEYQGQFSGQKKSGYARIAGVGADRQKYVYEGQVVNS
jgi:hypothetical protein